MRRAEIDHEFVLAKVPIERDEGSELLAKRAAANGKDEQGEGPPVEARKFAPTGVSPSPAAA